MLSGNSGALVISFVVLFGFVAVGLVVSFGAVFRSLGSLSRYTRRVDRTPRTILALEGTIILLAVVGVVLIRRRGLIAAGPGATQFAIDPYLAAVPVLLSLSAGLVTRRLVVLIARLIERAPIRRRGLVLMLGFRRIRSWTWAESLPLTVMIVAVSLGVFTFVINDSLEHAISGVSWQTVGADYQVQLPHGLPDSFNLSDVPGVQAIARSMVIDGVQLNPAGGQPRIETVVGLDPSAYLAVNAGSPAADALPAALVDVTPGEAWPGIATPSLLADLNLTVGSDLAIHVGNGEQLVHIIAVMDAFPGMESRTTFLLLPYAPLRAFADANGAVTSTEAAFVRGGPAVGHELRSALSVATVDAAVLSRDVLRSPSRRPALGRTRDRVSPGIRCEPCCARLALECWG